jgi:tetratricopeptide (TPR) repeat protein
MMLTSHSFLRWALPMIAGPLALLLTIGCAAGGAARGGRPDRDLARDAQRDLRFAAEMAEQGLWREALFRWQRVLESRPDDARLLNNIGVAHEALGDFIAARQAYERAAELAPDSEQITSNLALFRAGRDVGEADGTP